jgi:aminoglycoside/choline kinase family phosphotransferase
VSEERADAAHAFLARTGWSGAAMSALPGDASTRRYFRVVRNNHRAMLMDQPQGAEAPAEAVSATPLEREALGYNAVARLAGADCGRFVATAQYLRERGLGAPQVYAADPSAGFVLIEDLGDDLYAGALEGGADEAVLYGAAVDALAHLHAEPAPALLAPHTPLRHYDLMARLAEADLMTAWFIPLALGRAAHADEIDEHRALWHAALQSAPTGKPVFVHRDYHAQNLFWLPERSGLARLGMIDFQDAVAGDRTYDLVSLLEDARRDVTPELAPKMKSRYLAGMKAQGLMIDSETWAAEAAVSAAQRNAKIAGIFARLAMRDGKPRYLSYLPRVWGHLERDLDHPELSRLRGWYDRTIPREMRRVPAHQGALA